MFSVTEKPIDVSFLFHDISFREYGAIASFAGIVRRESDSRPVRALKYEAYVPMALKSFEKIAGEIRNRWGEVHLTIVHRVGFLRAGEIAVLVAAASKHRRESLAACSYAIDRVKQISPIWKKEYYEDQGAGWVESCESAHCEVQNVQSY